MAWRWRKKAVAETPAGSQNVPGANGFGFGPYAALHQYIAPPPPGIGQAAAWVTELLPVEQMVGPFFENRRQTETVRGGGISVPVQGVGLQVLPGWPTGTFAMPTLTDIDSPPFDIPIVANPPMGSFVLDRGVV